MLWKLKLRDLVLGCTLLAALVGLMAWPQEVIGAGKDGLAPVSYTHLLALY